MASVGLAKLLRLKALIYTIVEAALPPKKKFFKFMLPNL